MNLALPTCFQALQLQKPSKFPPETEMKLFCSFGYDECGKSCRARGMPMTPGSHLCTSSLDMNSKRSLPLCFLVVLCVSSVPV